MAPGLYLCTMSLTWEPLRVYSGEVVFLFHSEHYVWAHTNLSKTSRRLILCLLSSICWENSLIRRDRLQADCECYWFVGSFYRLIWTNIFLVAVGDGIATNGVIFFYPPNQQQHRFWVVNLHTDLRLSYYRCVTDVHRSECPRTPVAL